jgi:hypothetical protein
MTRHVRQRLLWASLVAFFPATIISAVVAGSISRRLERIIDFCRTYRHAPQIACRISTSDDTTTAVPTNFSSMHG